MNYVEPIRNKAQLHDMEAWLKAYNEKYYVMFEIGINSGLRVSDILSMRIRDLRGQSEIRVKEQKTGKYRMFPINRDLKKVLDSYCEGRHGGEFVVPSNDKYPRQKPISRETAYKVLRKAGEQVGLKFIGTHSMRKTFGYHFYKQTGDVALLMEILNHADPSITLRYIGINQETINERMKKFSLRGE